MTEHKFWDTQPVQKKDELINEHGPILRENPNIKIDNYNLPSGFEWSNIDVKKVEELNELTLLLKDHYVESVDGDFKLIYTSEFISWAICPPTYEKEWHYGIRYNGKLLAFMAGIPTNLVLDNKIIPSALINFLCVHRKLRSKRLAPVLIKEMVRRLEISGRTNIPPQALYTLAKELPTPICTSLYWYRPINVINLIKANFLKGDIKKLQKIYFLSPRSSSKLRLLEKKDCQTVLELLRNSLEKYRIHIKFTLEEFEHWFLPKKDIVTSYVIEDEENNIIDFSSFFTLYVQTNNIKLKIAYYFYSVSNKFMKDVLIEIKKLDYDLFNCLDIMDNNTFFDELKFQKGDQNSYLKYHLYNWRCKVLMPSEMAVIFF